MKTITLIFTAGQTIILDLLGNYFHLLETSAGVDIGFMNNGSVQGTAQNMEFGYFAKPSGGFSQISFKSASAQTIKIAVGIGDGGYNRTTGIVSLSNQTGTATHSQKSVTNAANTIMVSNAFRRGALVQNNSVGVMRLQFSSYSATPSAGIRIQPGGSYEMPAFAVTGSVSACMEVADATPNNVEVVEAQ